MTTPVARLTTAIAFLRGRGERVTLPRQAVLETLASTDEHLTADEIVSRAENGSPGVHRATVYRALSTLGSLGLVSHTHIGGSAAVYHLALPDADQHRHAHLQCTRCLRVFDVAETLLQPLMDQVDADLGFRIEPEHAALLGLCQECRAARP